MLYSIKLYKHTLRFDENDLDGLWDCFVEAGNIVPTYEMILKVIESDNRLLEKIVMFGTRDTEVRDELYGKLINKKYSDIIIEVIKNENSKR